jgi:hypothetical protein
VIYLRKSRSINIIYVIIAVIVSSAAFSADFSVYANTVNEKFEVISMPVNERRGTLEITGTLPVVSFGTDTHFAKIINELITDEHAKAVSRVSSRRTTLDFSSAVYESDGIVSILIYISERTGAVSNDFVRSVNFDVEAKTTVTLTSESVLGVNGVKIANRLLRDEAAQRLNFYHAVLPAVGESQAFYVDGSTVHLVFDRNAVAPGFRGYVEVAADRERIIELTVFARDYTLLHGFNIRMVALRPVAEAFGYDLSWHPASRMIEIYEGNNAAAVLTIGKINYAKGKTQAALDAAPIILSDNRAYVPAAFFEDALGISFTVSGRDIIFSKYIAGEPLYIR